MFVSISVTLPQNNSPPKIFATLVPSTHSDSYRQWCDTTVTHSDSKLQMIITMVSMWVNKISRDSNCKIKTHSPPRGVRPFSAGSEVVHLTTKLNFLLFQVPTDICVLVFRLSFQTLFLESTWIFSWISSYQIFLKSIWTWSNNFSNAKLVHRWTSTSYIIVSIQKYHVWTPGQYWVVGGWLSIVTCKTTIPNL